MDYKQKLFEILECFGDNEGVWHQNYWDDYGITKEESKQIESEFVKWTKTDKKSIERSNSI